MAITGGITLLQKLQKLYGARAVTDRLGKMTNVQTTAQGANNPFAGTFSKKYLGKNQDGIDEAHNVIMDNMQFAFGNQNPQQMKNFETNVNILFDMKFPPAAPAKAEAQILDLSTKKQVTGKGLDSLKKDLGLPQGVNKFTDLQAREYSANTESYRRPIIRQMLLKDTKIKLPDDVRKSLENKMDLSRGADPKMDPLRLLDEYYDWDMDKLDVLEDIRFTARDEFEAADEFLKKGGLEPKKNLGDKLKDLPDDIPDMDEYDDEDNLFTDALDYLAEGNFDFDQMKDLNSGFSDTQNLFQDLDDYNDKSPIVPNPDNPDDEMDKFFEIYHSTEGENANSDDNIKLTKWLELNLEKFDIVVVPDYGNGFITDSMAEVISRKSKFLAINTQINSGNRGYHVVNRYKAANFISLNEPELRLARHNRQDSITTLSKITAEKLNADFISVTMGSKGLYTYSVNSNYSFKVPALSSNVVDRVGAGDAFLSLASIFLGSGINTEVSVFLGAIAAAIDVQIVGNQTSINKIDLVKYLTSLMK